MSRLILCILILTSCFIREPIAGQTTPNGEDAFERLKLLQGEWVAEPAQGITYVSYRLASSGSTLVETMTAGERGMTVPPAMMSVYHLDNGVLMMTHYCGQGNQPRMRAVEVEKDRLRFSVMDVTNLPNPEASHMVGVTFTLKDASHFTQEWTNLVAGKEEKWTFEFARDK